MPELPEVETTRRALLPRVLGHRFRGATVRNASLRWPVTRGLSGHVKGEAILDIRRRGKYLLIDCPKGHVLVHLGMSGRLAVVADDKPAGRHDHVDLRLENETALRLTDPRRFGAILWLEGAAEDHPLLRGLGLEPLESGFTGAALRALATGRTVAVKQFLMNGRIVTGVGNIYASEALFQAGVHPLKETGRITAARWERIAQALRATLESALASGGSTLRDFASSDGRPGYFQHEFRVYARAGKPCLKCGTPIRMLRQGQRSTFFCPRCQR